ncbi:hypothetical protein E2P61_02035 [Candidatus Bathyarchaeota archaeon]|nr:hypothetical protein E2P61_02035 [Candidatus Bathyarchaeota archaeon]
MVKKSINQETTAEVIVNEANLAADSEENQIFATLSNNLAEIRQDKSVVGYIIRNTTSATIDLREPERIVEYAIFSSQVLDSSREISELFKLGNIESILIEGKENNALCMIMGGNKISIFIEKDANHSKILKRVSP